MLLDGPRTHQCLFSVRINHCAGIIKLQQINLSDQQRFTTSNQANKKSQRRGPLYLSLPLKCNQINQFYSIDSTLLNDGPHYLQMLLAGRCATMMVLHTPATGHNDIVSWQLVMVLLTNQNKRAQQRHQMGCINWPIHRCFPSCHAIPLCYATRIRETPLLFPPSPPDGAPHPSVKVPL